MLYFAIAESFTVANAVILGESIAESIVDFQISHTRAWNPPLQFPII